MSRLLLTMAVFCGLGVSAIAQALPTGEHIVVTGGVSLMKWEKYKVQPHDNWWLNFVRASRIRIAQLRQQYGPSAQITWLVYQRGYERRQSQEHESLFSIINSVRDKYGLNLIFFNSADQLCNYLNYGSNRQNNKIATFDYFGHSNKACFMFDYSNEIGSASKVWLHENELKDKLHRGIFARDARVQSWGCYTGESMSRKWYQATGAKMIGAVGKTQYMTNELPVLVSASGRWITGL
jgi:hypothetical protein